MRGTAMGNELEHTDDAIEPTVVYGPDDWRPYADNPTPLITPQQMAVVNAILADLFNAAGQAEKRKAYEYDPQSEAQRRLRQRMEFAGRLQNPNSIIRVTGTGM